MPTNPKNFTDIAGSCRIKDTRNQLETSLAVGRGGKGKEGWVGPRKNKLDYSLLVSLAQIFSRAKVHNVNFWRVTCPSRLHALAKTSWVTQFVNNFFLSDSLGAQFNLKTVKSPLSWSCDRNMTRLLRVEGKKFSSVTNLMKAKPNSCEGQKSCVG